MKKPVNIRLDKEILKKIKHIAKNKKTTFTQLVTDILLEYINNN